MKPYLIVITGRPGAGKTTLSERLSREWSLPLISRDRIKEGYVHTNHSTHDDLDFVDIVAMTDVTEHYASIATQILEKL